MVKTYFAIIGAGDECLYDQTSHSALKDGDPHDKAFALRQFIAHGALDVVEQEMFARNGFMLPDVDQFPPDLHVSAYVPYGPFRLLLVQDCDPQSNHRAFFQEAYELLVRFAASPFADLAAPIRSNTFRDRMRAIFTKHFH